MFVHERAAELKARSQFALISFSRTLVRGIVSAADGVRLSFSLLTSTIPSFPDVNVLIPNK